VEINKEELLEELEAVKHCIEMTHDNIEHGATRVSIVNALNKRIKSLEEEIDAKLATEKLVSEPFEIA